MTGQFRAAKESLAQFGFNIFFDDDGSDALTPWLTVALREFQIYASMGAVAQEKNGAAGTLRWLDRLQPAANTLRYTGPIDGVLTAAVQQVIDHWKTNRYRCPVVIELYVNNGEATWPPLDTGGGAQIGNYWRYDDPRIVKFVGPERLRAAYGKLQVRVCDMSGHFESAHQPGTLLKIGRLQKHFDFVGAALADSRVIGRESEVLPDVLTGLKWSEMTAPGTQKTFRVVRAVSELECLGYLQVINGYDDAWISLGPCHWTLALALLRKPPGPATKIRAGELPAFLAYWASEARAEADRFLAKPFGIGFSPAWKKGEPGKSTDAGWDATRNYTGRITWQAAGANGAPVQTELDTFGELEWFRTPHWYWRFLGLTRNAESFRKHQWNMTRLRLRDLLAYEIDPSDRPGKPAGSKTVPLSSLVTSEAGVALLLRMHVRKSGFVSGRKFNAPNLRLALALAGIAEPDPSKWSDPEELLLVEGLVAAAAFAGLTAEERQSLKNVTLENLPAHRAALANKKNPTGLRLDAVKLLAWPIAANFSWGPGNATAPRFALEQAAATPPLRRTRKSFEFDHSELPPLPE